MTAVPIRRFAMGVSAEGLDAFLNDLGYSVATVGHTYRVRKAGQPGRPTNLNRRGLVELLDRERVKQGLEPIVKPR